MLGDVQDMLVFAAVARAGSLTRAAAQLELPKSTVSRRLSALEERLGTRLLERTTRKLVLTEAGEAFLERCQRLADDVDDALAAASELTDQPRGHLRISLVPDLGPLLLAGPIARFHARHPQITIELDESPRYVDLAAERFDLALRAGNLPDSSLVARKVRSLASGVFTTPAYVEKVGWPKTPAELTSLSFVVLAGRTRFDRYTLQGPRDAKADVALRHGLVAHTSGTQRALVLEGAGAMVYTVSLCREDVAEGRLVRLLPDWTAQAASLWVVTPSRRLLPRKTALFIEHILRELAE